MAYMEKAKHIWLGLVLACLLACCESAWGTGAAVWFFMESNGQQSANYPTADAACRAQRDHNSPHNTYYGAYPYRGSWSMYSCDWERIPWTIPPGAVFLTCSDETGRWPPHTSRVYPGICVDDRRPVTSRPPCDYNQGANVNPTAGDPVILANGSLYEQVADFKDDPGHLAITRTYRSFPGGAITNDIDVNLPPSMMGNLWRANFEWQLAISEDYFPSRGSLAVAAPDGSKYGFHLNLDGTIVPIGNGVNGLKLALIDRPQGTSLYNDILNKGGKFLLTTGDGDQITLRFYVPTWSGKYVDAHPEQIAFAGGYVWNFSYGAKNELSAITDNYGRTMVIHWYNAISPDTGVSVPTSISEIVLPDATKLSYAYDGYGGTAKGYVSDFQRLRGVTRSRDGVVVDSTAYLYDAMNSPMLLTAVVDSTGVRTSTWTYDATGQVISAEGPGGVDRTTIDYATTDTGLVRTVTNALGKKTVYTFKSASAASEPLLTRIDGVATSSCVASAADLAYDGKGRIVSRKDTNGVVTAYTYGADGFQQSITEAVGTAVARTTTYVWNAAFGVPEKIVSPGMTAVMVHDTAGRLASTTLIDTATHNPDRTWTYRYTDGGLLMAVDGPRDGSSDTTTYQYDAQGFMVGVTNALGQVTRVEQVSANGLPLVIADPNGLKTTLAYDAMDRLTSMTMQSGTDALQTRVTYDAAGNISQIMAPGGASYRLGYDAARRLASVQDAVGNRIDYVRDVLGKVTGSRITDTSGTLVQSASAVFDELGRVLNRLGAGGQATTYRYDANNQIAQASDPMGHGYTYAYDPLRRLIAESGPLKHAVSYTYDAGDRLTRVTDAQGHATRYTYNGFGELVSQSSPDTGDTQFTYDTRGLVSTRTDARGVLTLYTYDVLGRLQHVSYGVDGANEVAYTYDDTTGGNPGIGRMTGMSDNRGQTRYRYDAVGRVTAETRISDGIASTTGYRYGTDGRLTALTYPSGLVIAYERDVQGRVAGLTMTSPAATTTVLSQARYLPFGEITGFVLGNGLAYRASFDGDYRLSDQSIQPGVQDVHYDRDANGNAVGITDGVAPMRHQTFVYDDAGRLTQATGSYGLLTYTYDASGNRLTASAGGGLADTYAYDPTSSRLTSVASSFGVRSLHYTDGGQVDGDSRGKGSIYGFHYDAAGRMDLAVLNGVPVIRQGYDGLQRRVAKDALVTGGGFRYHYDLSGQLLGMADIAGHSLRDVIWLDGRPVAQVDYDVSNAPTLSYLHPDALGRPQSATDVTGAVVWKAAYTPFGEPSDSSGGVSVGLGFPGQLRDEETGLYSNGFRDYDPSLGRYIEADPIGLNGGINAFAYAENNPVSLVDPSGLSPPCIFNVTLGRITCTSDTGNNEFDGPFASGNNGEGLKCRNNPACSALENRGPIPSGFWHWTDDFTPKPDGKVLEPDDSTDDLGRTLIRTHSCLGPFGPGTGGSGPVKKYCSEGCVTSTRKITQDLNKAIEPGRKLLVVPTWAVPNGILQYPIDPGNMPRAKGPFHMP